MTALSETSSRVARIAAHRANTLTEIRLAIESGVDFVEVDVRLTSDGEVVILHDETLPREGGEPVPVTELAYADLANVGEENVPLLSDALELFRESTSTLLIDVKEEEICLATIAAAAAASVVAVSDVDVAWCGNLEAMRSIRAVDDFARIWLPWAQRTAPPRELIEELRPEYVNSEYLVLSAEWVDDIHALGVPVSCWTVDDVDTMRWVLGLGVDSVTTNQPALLRETLEAGSATWVRDESESPLAIDELFSALETARELGEWAIEYSRAADRGAITTKAHPADLVTEVDVAVERHVREVIAARFPGHGFVGEEMGGEAKTSVPCWYLDPVDGTTNYANQIPWTSFSLALAVDNTPFVGVVSDPWRGDVFEAVAGFGARLNGVALALPATGKGDPLTGTVVSTELAGHRAWPGMIELLDALGDRYCIMRIMGSATLTVVGVAAGRGAGSVIGEFSAVDHLAAALIVQEAGGVVLDSEGRLSTFPVSGGIMVAQPAAADELYAIWRAASESAIAGAIATTALSA